ncbi:MAG TPA: DNA-processing protein DprA [Candidatus Eisenbacteria bacterium]|nr:DNA-processing protein DprA [Candidatus Eisenbacteria bacterium]
MAVEVMEMLRRALPQGQWPRRGRAPDDILLDRGAAILDACGARAVPPEDPSYPRGLRDLDKLERDDSLRPDPRVRRSKNALRPTLFLRGSWSFGRAVAIVGSRRATLDGVRAARELAAALASSGIAVVSGLAQGIDAAAHEGALDAGGRSGAVLGTSIEVSFPAAHAGLQERLADSLGVMTEVFPGSPSSSRSFSERNHLLAAISDLTVIIQGDGRSGALITTGAARAMERPVGAVPWDIYEALGAASHRLLHDGHAVLIRGPEDALALLGLDAALEVAPPAARRSLPRLDGAESLALAAIGRVPRPFDEIAAASGLTAPELGAALLKLEILGLARREAGGLVRRVPSPRRPAGVA